MAKYGDVVAKYGDVVAKYRDLVAEYARRFTCIYILVAMNSDKCVILEMWCLSLGMCLKMKLWIYWLSN